MKRIGLFLATNLAIVIVASLTLNILGVGSYLNENGSGLNLTSLLIFCAVFGMAGAFVSLFLSKIMAKWSARVQIIKTPATQQQQWLVQTVEELSKKAGIGMPDVGIFPASQSNAFATGWNKNNALVAVSEGLLRNMTKDEARAVVGHEIAHIANGDMITLTLIQGVINTFVMFFARIIGSVIDRVVFKNENGHGIAYFVIVFVCEMVLGILASTIVMWFSRYREFKADAGGAALTDRTSMINALRALQREQLQQTEMPDSLLAFGINSARLSGFKKYFASHPPLDVRIAALKS
ncbi:protease HtpX [Teredinibacter waterburyi]|uniref:protease HtpX n=1 Tax=Teredinibacter waterburyi TaxID=1500538 RepID=UPI00165FDE7E|nr:protease HtpX [Teredinibacter waterburyi]